MPDEHAREPLKSYHRILTEEIRLADAELDRTTGAIAGSGLLAGLGVCISVFLIGVLAAVAPGLPELGVRLGIGAAYAAGFLCVIFARADLFTEYTTITLLPVLIGRSSPGGVARFWGIVYLTNMIGAAAGALFLVRLGAFDGGYDPALFGVLASELVEGPVQGVFLGALFAGWLMGLLSWLIVAARDTISQILFVVLIGTVIGFGQLPHSITGTAEVLAALFAGSGINGSAAAGFVAVATIGNALGSVVFAMLVRYAVARPIG